MTLRAETGPNSRRCSRSAPRPSARRTAPPSCSIPTTRTGPTTPTPTGWRTGGRRLPTSPIVFQSPSTSTASSRTSSPLRATSRSSVRLGASRPTWTASASSPREKCPQSGLARPCSAARSTCASSPRRASRASRSTSCAPTRTASTFAWSGAATGTSSTTPSCSRRASSCSTSSSSRPMLRPVRAAQESPLSQELTAPSGPRRVSSSCARTWPTCAPWS
mmetsp:Transcript_1519/g.4648  ORF Transcript_1519/g.4648 Transcript_1519/m.4648 type:complete len:220 (-) Transcript_1519:270-929(-)